jgi:DNA primase
MPRQSNRPDGLLFSTQASNAHHCTDEGGMESDNQNIRRQSELIRNLVDYAAFFGVYFPNARPRSGKLQVVCPIPSHGHSGRGQPGLSIDLKRGLFHCFSRDEGGDLFRFYELMHGVKFSDAVRAIAGQVGVSGDTERFEAAENRTRDYREEIATAGNRATAHDVSEIASVFLDLCRAENQDEGLKYLESRGIKPETAKQVGVTYFPRSSYRSILEALKERIARERLQASGLFNQRGRLTFYRHRLLFPFYIDGQVSYLQARTISDGVEPRWHNLRGTVPSLYNVDSLGALTSGSIVYLVEGFTDTLTLLSHGFNAVGIVGASGFKEEWLALLGRFTLIAALDGDDAGNLASTRYEEMFHRRSIPLVRLRLPADVNDFFRNNPAAALEVSLLTEGAIEASAGARRNENLTLESS